MILNLPNILAIIRVFLSALLFFILLLTDKESSIHITWLNLFAGVTFLIACVTDFFDGFIARRWNQITKFGAIVDPLADKMLILAGFLGLMMNYRANPWIVYIILVREFFITGFRILMASDGVEISASMAGKVKTVFQMFAIGFLCMQWNTLGIPLLYISLILTLYSGFEYVYAYVKQTSKGDKNGI